ncbi:putative Arv1 [Quillaja saponaria]|uniref:Protein ARV n=1 Tax=Quillaja saponaria TaxID=32244 RepID=A0AAD7LS95_QUISA|nr:putative Arv1 [Quillaja saponaria]
MAYRCVQCGFPIKTLYVQYSPGNIRLMKCENCKAVADEYIECEVMVHNPFEKLELYLFKILLIDLILHKPKAYRHLLYNVLNQETVETEGLFWKSTLSFLLLDAYRSLILESSREDWGSSRSFTLLILTCWKMLMDVFFGNLMFFSTFLIMVRIFLRTSLGNPRDKDIVLAISISSYVKVFLIAMMFIIFGGTQDISLTSYYASYSIYRVNYE